MARPLTDDAAGSFAIEVRDLQKYYGATRAVDGLSLAVQTGEVFGLLGRNGAGKTTTVEIMEGYRRPDRGSVRVLGLDPATEGPKLHPHIGVMLQEGGLYQGVRPLELLRLFAAFYDDPRDPEQVLELVGLEDARRTTVRRLSGGQKQRLSLGLALIGNPSLLFLDEPTAGMDPHARARTWDLVRELRAAGATILLTTHAMDEAEELCDHVAIIDRGRLLAGGTPAELTHQARVREVRFSAQPGLPTVELAAALSISASAVLEVRPGEYVVGAEGIPDLIADLAVWLRDHGAQLTELSAGQRTLEEVFLDLTRDDPE
jgi:ABC-2 type transport system ATP-binding protein